MRRLLASCVLLLWCGLAFGQAGWIEPGTYSEPFTPRLATPSASPQDLVTPSLTLDSPALVTGASNGTAFDTGVHFNQPLWYAPDVDYNQPLFPNLPIGSALGGDFGESTAAEKRRLELGAATFQSAYGVAQLMRKAPGPKAGRVFTNSDLARLNDANGTIRYAGKVERIEQRTN
jgi:hypothetical protein